MPIDHEQTTDAPEVREGPGWRQRTPGGDADRLYNDCAPTCAIAEVTTDDFHAMSVVKKRGVPTSFESAAVYMVVDESLANWDHLCSLHPTEEMTAEFGETRPSRRQEMVSYRDISLTRAANRGTGAHAYMEDRILGREPNWDYVAKMGSLPWLAAVENFLDREQPEAVLIETVAFDREHMVAGTVDALLRIPRLGLAEIDWKSRNGKEKRHHTHTRRPEEAIQLGGYHKMLTKGYYMDDRGRRQRITESLAIAVVTFGPDGTYAIHEVDPDAAERGYELAVEMWRSKNLTTLMPNKAIYSEDFDPNPALARAIDNVPDDVPEKMMLAKAWQEAGLGKPSKGEVEPGRYGEAMHLIYTHTRRFQPFAADTAEPVGIVPAHIVGELAERLRALPEDIAEEARRNAAGLPLLTSLCITEADVEDWDRVLQVAETAHQARQREAVNVMQVVKNCKYDTEAILALLPDNLATWTDAQLTVATAVASAAYTCEIVPHGAADHSQEELLNLHGTKSAVKKLANERADEYGLDRVSKWDDLTDNPVLWAVLVSA